MKTLALILALAATANAEPRQVTLKDALSLAAKQSPDVAAANAQAQIAQAGVKRAWTAWQPDLSAGATFDHTSAPASFDLSQLVLLNAGVFGIQPVNTKIIPAPIDIVASNSEYANIQLVQPLLTPQGLFAIPAANAGAHAAQLGAQEAREQILLGTARAFLSLAAVNDLIAAAQDAEKTALARENDARKRMEAGVGLAVELSRAQSETAQSRATIAALQGQKASLEALLVQLTGESIAPAPGEVADFAGAGGSSSDPWQSTFAVQSAEASVDAARKALRLDEFAWLPTIAGVAKGNYNSNEGFAGKNTSYDLIVTASIPLYDRGARYAASAEDEAKLAAAEANLASERARARATWDSARANVDAAQAGLEQANADLAFATQAKQQVEASVQSGTGTNLELSDADTHRFQAASAVAQAKATLQIRKVELAAAEGRLYASVAQ